MPKEDHPDDVAIRDFDPPETLRLVETTLVAHFPAHDSKFLSSVFGQVQSLFAGQHPDYQACDTSFHDLAHTCQATVATARLLDGHIKSGQSPALTARDVELGVTAAFLHDVGYLKERGDNEGTGAKYTPVHVQRSAGFAAKFLPAFAVTPDEVHIVQSAIYCTGVYVDSSRLDFRDESERFISYALGTGDILGQMAASDYPERLPALYREFKEAVAYFDLRQGGIASYQSAEDLLRKTRAFYEDQIRRLLEEQWGGVYQVLPYHFPDGRNHYFRWIEANLDRIDEILAAADDPVVSS